VQLKELLDDVEVLALRGDPRTDVSSLTHDSRRVGPGSCFACVPGASTDGHLYAPAAVDAGAVALLVERPLELGVAEAKVVSVRQVLGPAAARLHGFPSRSMRCVGVTGTNGKTTTTYLLEGIASAAGERVGIVGTTGARVDGAPIALDHTTPEATELQSLLAAMRDSGVTTVAMEVSSHALEQHRVDGTWFAAVAFTNLSHDHLDYHGSLDAYFEAKAKLFELERSEFAAINIDDPHGRVLVDRSRDAGLATMTFALDDPSADLVAEDVAIGATGTRFLLRDTRDGMTGRVHLELLGRANVSNALAAAALALASGLAFEAVVAGLSSGVVVPGRLERIDAGQQFTVLVDYAHTPDALAAALDAARAVAGTARVIVAFGCGGDRDRAKRPLMGQVAARGADVVVLTSDNPRSEAPDAIAADVLEGLRDGPARVLVELDRRVAIGAAFGEAATGDVVVLAGKGHETAQTGGGVTVAFDDRLVAREELGARQWS